MTSTKADTIAQLRKDILSMQGLRSNAKNAELDAALGPVKYAFPNASFPLAAVHEFISKSPEAEATTGGFVAVLVAALMRQKGALIWISASRTIFPPALKAFGIEPDRIIFIDLQKEKQVLWAMEEALKCKGLSAVVGEMQELNFTASRRLQLAVENSKVTGFVLRRNPRVINTTACVTRWQITAAPTALEENMPGIGFPRWQVELLKVRNGSPGKWLIEFAGGRYRHISKIAVLPFIEKKKTG